MVPCPVAAEDEPEVEDCPPELEVVTEEYVSSVSVPTREGPALLSIPS